MQLDVGSEPTLRFAYCKTLKFREHFIFAQIRESASSYTFPAMNYFLQIIFSTFGPVQTDDRQKVMHMSPPCRICRVFFQEAKPDEKKIGLSQLCSLLGWCNKLFTPTLPWFKMQGL